jgi:asparagine synthase (glutamine-hydrolysing)
MTDALAHRVPDGDGFYDSECVAFGHRRLAIIDRAGGRQPIANEDDTCWIIFNGEVYNHRRLRPELEARGHRFRTHSDTETILHAYEEYGSQCVEKLDGMFAFAIYDGRRNELFAARDRVGKKPFFFTWIGGVFYFASELPALRLVPGWRPELDRSALETYLSLGYFVAPGTVFKDVTKLLPAHWLRVDASGDDSRKYWDICEFDTEQRSAAEITRDIDETLRGAVDARLESEVPLGAFLSGGIDSGLVVSYMAERMAGRLVTTSVGFEQKGHNELDVAATVASHFGSAHFADIVQPRLDESIGPIIEHLGEPMADSSAIPSWYVSREARKHVTVALSGDGGDEAWAGYDFRNDPLAIEQKLRRLVLSPMRPLFRWTGAHWPRGARIPRALRAGAVLENLAGDPSQAYYSDLAFMKPHSARELMGTGRDRSIEHSPAFQAVAKEFHSCKSSDLVQKAGYADLKVYLPNDPLVKVDRMSMAHSLEVRCPFLDRKVLELAFRIPASMKRTRGRGKLPLRALARQRLPEGVWKLPKRGFTMPIGTWIAQCAADRYREEVLDGGAATNSCIDRAALERRYEEHRSGRRDHSYSLWAVWVLERWLRSSG